MIQNQAHELQDKRNFSATKFIAITSGKGGVGKSNISANLAYCLWKYKKRVAVFDADIGLANLDLIFGIRSQKNILHALRGEASFQEIIYPIEEGLYLIPGDNGEEILKYANSGVFDRFLDESDILNDTDYIIIDTGAGIGGVTQDFLNASDMVVVVTMPDPSALTDAYATIKLNSKIRNDIFMILNMVKNAKEAQLVFERIVGLAHKNIPSLHEIVVKAEPLSAVTGQIETIAKNILAHLEQNMVISPQKQHFADFFRRVFGYL